MSKQEVFAAIEETGVIAAVRVRSKEDAIFAAEVVSQSGIHVVEIALTVPEALMVIKHLAKSIPGIVVGAGSVGKPEIAFECLDSGAQFLTSDGFYPPMVEFGTKHNVIAIPGALTPTEIISAWEAKADFVKVVPCTQFGGPAYIRSLHEMFPQIPLIASGGVHQQTASDFILAGAVALGIGHELIPKEAIRLRHSAQIGELARRFLDFVKSGRADLAARSRGFSP